MYDKTRKPRPNARGPRLPTMHPFTIVFTEMWATNDFRANWAERHAQAQEPEGSARLAHVRFNIQGALGILREIRRNQAWWEKAKRTAREKAIFDAVFDLGRYMQLTGVRYSSGYGLQPLDDEAFRALERKTPEAVAAQEVFKAMMTGAFSDEE